jgi:hypothetical protein
MEARALRPEGGQITHSWGFFLIEKRMEHTAHRHIEVLLYPETRP